MKLSQKMKVSIFYNYQTLWSKSGSHWQGFSLKLRNEGSKTLKIETLGAQQTQGLKCKTFVEHGQARLNTERISKNNTGF